MLAAITAGLALLALVTPLVGAEFPGTRVGWLLACAAAIEMLHGLRRATTRACRHAAVSALISLLIAFSLINASADTFPALRVLIAIFFAIDVVRYAVQAIRQKETQGAAAGGSRGIGQHRRAPVHRAPARVGCRLANGMGGGACRRGPHRRHRLEHRHRAHLRHERRGPDHRHRSGPRR